MRMLRSALIFTFFPLLLISLGCSSLIRSGTQSSGTAKPKASQSRKPVLTAKNIQPTEAYVSKIRISSLADAQDAARHLAKHAIGRTISIETSPFIKPQKAVLLSVSGMQLSCKGTISNFKQNLEDVTEVIVY